MLADRRRTKMQFRRNLNHQMSERMVMRLEDVIGLLKEHPALQRVDSKLGISPLGRAEQVLAEMKNNPAVRLTRFQLQKIIDQERLLRKLLAMLGSDDPKSVAGGLF